MDRYTHQYPGREIEALEVLPDLSQTPADEARATGTDQASGGQSDPQQYSQQSEHETVRTRATQRDFDCLNNTLLAGIPEDCKPLSETKKRDVLRDDAKESETVGVGFEPTVTQRPRRFFKTGPFNRSGTPPANDLEYLFPAIPANHCVFQGL